MGTTHYVVEDGQGNIIEEGDHPEDRGKARRRELRAKIAEFARGNRGGISLPDLAEIVFSLAVLVDDGFDE